MTARRSWWAWLLNLPRPDPVTRLTSDEAIAIAAKVPSVIALERPLLVASVREEEGRAIWTVGSGGIGSQWWIEIDDHTGEVGELRHFVGR